MAKTTNGKKDNDPEPQDQSHAKNGETKDRDNCDYKTSKYEDLFGHMRKSHLRQGLKHKCPECNFSKSIPARIKQHVYEPFFAQ